MRLFGGVSPKDREHLVSTLQSLGPTSMAGLSAALSWSQRRTQRTVQEVARWGEGAILVDPVTRSVALRSASTSPVASVAAAPTSAPVVAATATPPALPKAWGASAKCPTCQVTLTATGTGTGYYCPHCGRLSSPRGSSHASAPGAPASSPAPGPSGPQAGEPPAPPRTMESLAPDRRSQELFAAWVSARPIPCPKCRTTLRHHGVAEYACPSCGARVAFDRSSAPATLSNGRVEAPRPAPVDPGPPALPAR